MRLTTLPIVFVLCFAACQCGGTHLMNVPPICDTNPEFCDAGVIDPIDAGPGSACTDLGTVTGRVCATDQQTWLNGATVSVDAIDCNNMRIHVETTSAADGTFTLTGVPPGTSLVVHAELGAFTQDTPVTVTANMTTAIPDNQLCVAQKAVKIAVVTGAGDKIEDLLTSLNLQFTLFGGDSSTWTSQAEPFLSDLNQMKQYDLIFVDCAAAKKSGTTIDLGSNAALIGQNLHNYVLGGGSVYASDWALIFTLAASPSNFTYATANGAAIGNPLDAKQLIGFAPQTVSATVTDPALAQFLGKSSLNIGFPKQTGAVSLHWGLMSAAPGSRVLVAANGVQVCADTTCATASGSLHNGIPLAVRARLLPAGQKGGNVVYTSFHNIAQSGNDVAQVLKYLVLNL